MRPRSTCTTVQVWRRKGTAHDPKHTTSSVKHGGGSVMAWACMAANRPGSHVFIDDVTADKAAGWILKCFEQYYLLIFSQMLQNSLDGASQCRWTMTQSILQKQPKSFYKANKCNVMQWPNQSPDFWLFSLSHYFWSLKNWESYTETVVIPTPFTWFGCVNVLIFVDQTVYRIWILKRCTSISRCYAPQFSAI